MSVDSNQNKLPPSPFVRQFAANLQYGPLDILDVGCCIGRNAMYLAEQGHRVVGLSKDIDELRQGKQIGGELVQFVAGEIRQLPFKGLFDVILMNEVLHQLPKSENKQIIRSLQGMTKPGGFHAVSDYIGAKPAALKPFELRELYQLEDWQVVEYHEDTELQISFGDEALLSSLATIIATKI